MAKSPFIFGNAISLPTSSAWSTVYSAGNIAAVISLSSETQNPSILASAGLASAGKKLLQTLEAEYFTLETKTLASIKQAISATCEKKPEGIELSLTASVLIENVLYVFMYGKGLAFMKRGDKIGELLSQKEKSKLTAASGFLQHEDYIVLEAGSFPEIVKKEDISPFLTKEKLSGLSDGLLSLLTDAQIGDAAAIAFFYSDETMRHSVEPASRINEQAEDKNNLEIKTSKDAHTSDTAKHSEILQSRIITHQKKVDEKENFTDLIDSKEPFLPETKSLPHKKKIFLTIAVVVGIVLIASVFFFVKKQQDQAIAKIYLSFVVPAQQKYDEGQNLLQLNKIAAGEDFSSARQLLSDALMRLPLSSKEAQSAHTLLAKVNNAINVSSRVVASSAKQVDAATSPFLAAAAKHSDALGATQNDKFTYILTSGAIISIEKSSGKETTIIKNSGDWKSGTALGTYLGNFYVLDSSDGIVKYVSTGTDYGKTAYFTNQKPDLSNSIGMAIDQSIWTLSSDGTIKKFTKGDQDSLNLSGLDKPLKNPTAIATNVDMDNVYILDAGNNRIVVFDKKRGFVEQYQYSGMPNLKFMDVMEKDKKIYVLSGTNVYEIDMK